MAAGGHFGLEKITFDSISRHFISIPNFFFSQNGCRRPFWMAENHFRSHFSPFQINTQLFFHKMAAGGHFGLAKIAFDRISRHFRSILNFFLIFFHKMSAGAHFGWPKSLSITFLTISDPYATFIFFYKNGCQRLFWMTENNFWSHFSPFQINTQIWFFHKMAASAHFGGPKITFEFFKIHKMAASGYFG